MGHLALLTILLTKTRKKRATKKEIKDFAKWALKNEVYDIYSFAKIREMYMNETGVDLTVWAIRLQKTRWILIDGEVYDVNQPWLYSEKKGES